MGAHPEINYNFYFEEDDEVGIDGKETDKISELSSKVRLLEEEIFLLTLPKPWL